LPGFNAAQAYGLGIPQVFISGAWGNPHDEFLPTKRWVLLPAGFLAAFVQT